MRFGREGPIVLGYALALASAGCAQTPVSFFQPESFGFCLYVAAADFNGDGNLDVACSGNIAVGLPGNLTIWLGDGKGHFRQTRQSLPYVQPQVVAGDFNGDGFQDLVVGGSSQLLLLPGHGDGTFGPQMVIADLQVDALAAGDLRNDGRLDVLVATPSSYPNSTVEVFLNNGDGTFQSPIQTGVTVGSLINIAVADFNGDDILDIASMYYTTGVDGSGAIEVALGNGDGTFGTPVETLTGTNAGGFAVADFAGNGHLGVAFGSAYANGLAVAVFNGNGDGTFSPGPMMNVPAGSVVLSADLNGDGKPDLVVNGLQPGILLNQGGGTFGPVMLYQGEMAFGGVAANFRHTVLPDLVIGGDFYPNDGTGHFRVPHAYEVTSCNFCWTLAAGDFNGDGNLDAAVTQGGIVSVYDGNGHGEFNGYQQTPYRFPDNETLSVATAADFNNDGKLDLALGTQNYARGKGEAVVVLGNGDGTFGPEEVAYTGYPVYVLATADFNKDGYMDLAVGTKDGVVVVLSNGAGGFNTSATIAGIASTISLVVADFNGDGIPDLATASDVYLGNGDGTFQHSYVFPEYGSIVKAGDFYGNRIVDLVTVVGSNSTANLILWPGNGDGTFGVPLTIASGSIGEILVADMNADGNPDIVNIIGSTTTIYLGRGNGTFTVEAIKNLPVPSPLETLGDFSNDGLLDILLITGNEVNGGPQGQLMTVINTTK